LQSFLCRFVEKDCWNLDQISFPLPDGTEKLLVAINFFFLLYKSALALILSLLLCSKQSLLSNPIVEINGLEVGLVDPLDEFYFCNKRIDPFVLAPSQDIFFKVFTIYGL
jgi:hypothetical protein